MSGKNCKHFGCYEYAECYHGPNSANKDNLSSHRYTLKTEAVLERVANLNLAQHPQYLAEVLALFVGLLGESIRERCKITGWDPDTGKPSKYGWCAELELWNGWDDLIPDGAIDDALGAMLTPDEPVVFLVGDETFFVEKRMFRNHQERKSFHQIIFGKARVL